MPKTKVVGQRFKCEGDILSPLIIYHFQHVQQLIIKPDRLTINTWTFNNAISCSVSQSVGRVRYLQIMVYLGMFRNHSESEINLLWCSSSPSRQITGFIVEEYSLLNCVMKNNSSDLCQCHTYTSCNTRLGLHQPSQAVFPYDAD